MTASRFCVCLAALMFGSVVPSASRADDHPGHDVDAASAASSAKLLDDNKMTLAKAVAQMENISGGRAVSAACRYDKDPQFSDSPMVQIEMRAIEQSDLWDARLDHKGVLWESGIAKREGIDAKAAKQWDDWLVASKAMADAKMTLAKAIEAAEKHSNGRALVICAVVTDKTTTICAHCLVGDKVVCCHVALDGKVSDAPAKAAEKPKDDQKSP